MDRFTTDRLPVVVAVATAVVATYCSAAMVLDTVPDRKQT
jgi:hypothetical protein